MPKFAKILLVLIIGGMVFGFTLNKGVAQEEPPFLVKDYDPPTTLPLLERAPEKALKAPRPLYVPDEIIVKFKPGIAKGLIEQLLTEQEALEKYESRFAKFKVLKIPKGKTVPQLVEIFKKNPLVDYAEPNYYAYATMVPNDPAYQYQWHFDNPIYGGIQMESAWDISTGTSSVVVAVVDTGIAYEDYPAPDHWHIDTYRAYSGHSWWCGMYNPSWPKSPGYGNGWKDYLQHSFNLTTSTGAVTLTYQYRHDLEVTAGVARDKAFTEVSTNNGVSWTTLKTYTGNSKVGGTSVAWKAESLDLTTYKGSNILLRFRFNSDKSVSDEDGHLYKPSFDSDGAIFIDEIKITHGGGTLFYDKVESGPGTWETTKYQKAPDLAGTSFVAGYDFINNDAHPNDDDGHGTHVAGTIAQSTNNNLGVAGIAFNTTIMPVKVLSAAGSGTYQQVADGIYYAANNGAKIINMSLGGSSPATVLEEAVASAYNKGVTVLAAAGNDNSSTLIYPAAYNAYVIAVGATQYDEIKAPYSNYGSSLDIVAPGGNTGVDQNGDGYADGVLQNTFGNTPVDWAYWFYQGTSMATPHASGLAALILALNPALTPDEVRNILQSTAEDKSTAGWDSTYGWGIIDAQAALESLGPAIVTLTRSNFPANLWQMISLPLEPENPDPEVILSDDLGNIFYNWTLARWQPFEGVYKYHKAVCCPWATSSESILPDFSPGLAYWLIARLGPTDIDASGTLTPDNDYYIHLLPGTSTETGGWNQIGVPFNYSVAWASSTIKVKNTATGQTVDLDTAQDEEHRWIENKIWWREGTSTEYSFAITPQGQLDPWQGYWVHNFIECDLIVLPTPLEGAGGQAASAETSKGVSELKFPEKPDWMPDLPPTTFGPKKVGGWKLQLSISAGSEKDTYNFAGLNPAAEDDYDALDVLEPPPISKGVSLYFPHQDWSFNPGNYTQDIRKSDFKNKEWNFEIKNELKQTAITLKWFDLEQVEYYDLSLIDLDTNQTINIYNTNEYTFILEKEGVRHFKLIAEVKSGKGRFFKE